MAGYNNGSKLLASTHSLVNRTRNTLSQNAETSLIPVSRCQTYEILLLGSISILSLCLNFMVIIAILGGRSTRKRVTNVFAASLCATQVLVSGLVLPTFCVPFMTVAHEHFSALAIMSYVMNLCAITFERHVAVRRSLRYNELMHYSIAVKIVISCWLAAFFIQLIPMLWMHTSYTAGAHKVYLVFILVVFLVLPLVYLLYSYSVIYIEVKKLLKRERINSLKPANRRNDSTRSISRASMKAEATVDMNLESLAVGFNRQQHMLSANNDGSQATLLSDSCAEENASTSQMKQHKLRQRKIRKSKITGNTVKVTTVFAIAAFTYVLTWFPVIYMTLLEVIERKDLEPRILKLISAFTIGVNSVIDPLLYGFCLNDVRQRMPILRRR